MNFIWEESGLYTERGLRYNLKFQTTELKELWETKRKDEYILTDMIHLSIEAGKEVFVWYFINEDEQNRFISCSEPSFTISLSGMRNEDNPIAGLSVYWTLRSPLISKPVQLCFPDEEAAIWWLDRTCSIFTTNFNEKTMEFYCNGGIDPELWIKFAVTAQISKNCTLFIDEKEQLTCLYFSNIKDKRNYRKMLAKR